MIEHLYTVYVNAYVYTYMYIYIYVNGCVPDWSLHLLRASAGQQESMYSHYQPES